jgi:hypothetical protein
MALHREVYKLGLRDGISNRQCTVLNITAMIMNTIFNTKPLSYITGLIREFQHINSTNTVGYY